LVGFNSGPEVDLFYLDSQEHIVAKGSGTYTFTASAIPVDWGAGGAFQAYVNMSENPHPAPWTPLASTVSPISVLAARTAPDAGMAPIAAKSVANFIQCNRNVCL
jgi:hypothetical protein